jgi:hypothetical protein
MHPGQERKSCLPEVSGIGRQSVFGFRCSRDRTKSQRTCLSSLWLQSCLENYTPNEGN